MPAQSYPSIGSAAYVNISLSQTITGAKTFLAGSATSVPVTVQAFTGQTSDIFQVQGSTGTVLASFARGGQLALSDTGLTNGDGTGAKVWLRTTGSGYFSNSVAADRVLVLKGAASQTANLQEWQQSDGTVRAAVGYGGAIKNVDDSNYFGIAPIVTSLWTGTPTLGISPTLSSRIGLAIRGVASQTANLQEWQNSAGTVLKGVYSNGATFITPSATASTSLFLRTGQASAIGMEVRASASQTANILEIQNSAGTVLSGFDGAGWPILIAGVQGGTGLGSYWGRAPVNVPGTGTRWLALYN